MKKRREPVGMHSSELEHAMGAEDPGVSERTGYTVLHVWKAQDGTFGSAPASPIWADRELADKEREELDRANIHDATRNALYGLDYTTREYAVAEVRWLVP